MMSYYIFTVSQPKVEKEHRVLLVSLDEALDRGSLLALTVQITRNGGKKDQF